jgi:hypothetical protein
MAAKTEFALITFSHMAAKNEFALITSSQMSLEQINEGPLPYDR